MTPVTTFAGRRVALFGLGGSGLATAKALVAGGADVVAWDDGEAGREAAREAGIPIADLHDADWGSFASFVLSPGVPLTHPEPHWTVALARGAGVEIIGDIELFCRERAALCPDAPLVAITGTNGKSTTTALTAHVLRTAGWDVQMGGNIGVPILALEPPSADRVHVIECSSFQIDLAPSLAATVGILTNLTPDHIDRHGSMENYAAVKERLVDAAETALVGVDDDFTWAIGRRRHAKGPGAVPVSVQRRLPWGVYRDGARILSRRPGARRSLVLGDLAGIGTLRGRHNAQNAAFAAGAAQALGVDAATIQQGLSTFPGLPHRMETVARLGHVLFVNDSKATNADAAEKALLSFRDVFWIIGGKSKEGGIEPLRPLFDRVRKAYLIGAATDDFAATLGSSVAHERSGTLDVALESAARDALAASDLREAVVLLSPACASYDQFRNFEVRGDAFRTLAQDLVQQRTAGG